jgi:hypothetical protein
MYVNTKMIPVEIIPRIGRERWNEFKYDIFDTL